MNNRLQINSEVVKMIENLRLEIAKLKIDRAMKTMKNTNTIRNKQKEISRLFAGVLTPAQAQAPKPVKSPKKEVAKKEDKQ